jgi:hypothetical protein
LRSLWCVKLSNSIHIINLTVTQGYTSVNEQQTAGAGT